MHLSATVANDRTRQDSGTSTSAAEQFASGDFRRALASYEQILVLEPDNLTALYNAGQCAYLLNEFAIAEQHWTTVDRLSETTDFRVKEKLIQTLEKRGETERVASAITELESLHASALGEGYGAKESFCRDQFQVGPQRLISHQHFGFPVSTEHRYTIYAIDETGSPTCCFEYNSPATTTSMAREAGELTAEERLFAIEHWRDGTVTTHELTKEPSDYARFKRVVSTIIAEQQALEAQAEAESGAASDDQSKGG